MTYKINQKKLYFIAEAGVNHNGDCKLALKLVDAAISAGADAIKFQTFKSENLVSHSAVKADYQKLRTRKNESQFEMLKSLELSEKEYFQIKKYCQKKKIDFITTAFDEDSLQFIVKKLKVKILKIPSGEITNGPLLLAHGLTGLKIILSTGMSSIQEIREALSVIVYGYMNKNKKFNNLTKKAFLKALNSKKGQSILKKKITILHCTTEYPAPIDDINLDAIYDVLKNFNANIGYSDHSKGELVSLAAASMGVKIIEKHFTLNQNMVGPDHKASLNPAELKSLIRKIRKIETIKGIKVKKAYKSEIKNIHIARKVLIARKEIRIGEKFNDQNMTAKRAGKGINPMNYWKYLGKKSTRVYKKDEIIK
tara:strand:+ start:4864 stop:5964 length:1101 start_codon:yes stop_codon:yes gene_type:complete